MKKSWWIVLFIALVPAVLACSEPIDGKTYTENQEFCNKNYYLPNGINVGADNIVIDCRNAVLQGDFKEAGIKAENRQNIEIQNCHIVNYKEGIYLKNTTRAEVHHSNLLRNYIGLKLEESSQNHFYENRDVSIKQAVQDMLSAGNHIRYTNKNIEGDTCRHNSCNKYWLEPSPTPRTETLAQILQAAINKWINMG